MNKRKKYVIRETSIQCLGAEYKRILMSEKKIMSFSRQELACEIVGILNKAKSLSYGELAKFYEIAEIPRFVDTKNVSSVVEFIESL